MRVFLPKSELRAQFIKPAVELLEDRNAPGNMLSVLPALDTVGQGSISLHLSGIGQHARQQKMLDKLVTRIECDVHTVGSNLCATNGSSAINQLRKLGRTPHLSIVPPNPIVTAPTIQMEGLASSVSLNYLSAVFTNTIPTIYSTPISTTTIGSEQRSGNALSFIASTESANRNVGSDSTEHAGQTSFELEDAQALLDSRVSGFEEITTTASTSDFRAMMNGSAIELKEGGGHSIITVSESNGQRQPSILTMTLSGGSNSTGTGLNQNQGVRSYLLGNDSSRWVYNARSFGTIRYDDVYTGVDIQYYMDAQNQLKYDFVVSPFQNPAQISIDFDGQDSIAISQSGSLLLGTEAGVVEHEAPYSYQLIDGIRQTVASSYTLLPNGNVGYQLGNYDHSRELIIDPVIEFSTLLGGSTGGFPIGSTGVDRATAITYKNGYIFVAGQTYSSDWPGIAGSTPWQIPGTATDSSRGDSFLAVIRDLPGAKQLVSTVVYGGTYEDYATALTLSSDGYKVYLTGVVECLFPTASAGFPGSMGEPYFNTEQYIGSNLGLPFDDDDYSAWTSKYQPVHPGNFYQFWTAEQKLIKGPELAGYVVEFDFNSSYGLVNYDFITYLGKDIVPPTNAGGGGGGIGEGSSSFEGGSGGMQVVGAGPGTGTTEEVATSPDFITSGIAFHDNTLYVTGYSKTNSSTSTGYNPNFPTMYDYYNLNNAFLAKIGLTNYGNHRSNTLVTWNLADAAAPVNPFEYELYGPENGPATTVWSQWFNPYLYATNGLTVLSDPWNPGDSPTNYTLLSQTNSLIGAGQWYEFQGWPEYYHTSSGVNFNLPVFPYVSAGLTYTGLMGEYISGGAGGGGNEVATGITLDPINQTVIVTGYTNSSTFYTTAGAIQPNKALSTVTSIPNNDMFIQVRSMVDLSVIYSTYYGGPRDDRAMAIWSNGSTRDQNTALRITLTGAANQGFPTTANAYKPTGGSSLVGVPGIAGDAVFMELTRTSAQQYAVGLSTFFAFSVTGGSLSVWPRSVYDHNIAGFTTLDAVSIGFERRLITASLNATNGSPVDTMVMGQVEVNGLYSEYDSRRNASIWTNGADQYFASYNVFPTNLPLVQPLDNTPGGNADAVVMKYHWGS